ncbi:MAG TPA: fumarylacetoacetase [Thermoanaerobaculia bacterium]|nr:fumarylacetoacetase [Thermoanaerobaculia bacterium]
MSRRLDETHDSALRSWVPGADDTDTEFPVQNLPFCRFRHGGSERARIGVGIGDCVLDLARARHHHLVKDLRAAVQHACVADTMFQIMALDAEQWWALRRRLSALLSEPRVADLVRPCLVPRSEVELLLPARVGDYTDFYASIHHATNIGRLFRPDQPLLPNYRWVPIGYHGRSSSVVISGTPVRRPCGQRAQASGVPPEYGPTRSLDYELEVGFFVGGTPNVLGESVPISRAEDRVFGLCLVNDWSARDIQAWEYQPLGPFLGKSFATSISPWIVTLDALQPFRVPAPERSTGDPEPLPYLRQEPDSPSAIDIRVEALLRTEGMRAVGLPPHRLGASSFRDMYWTIGQMVAHHASNGCPLRAGDLMASGTVSGPETGSLGCLLEITRRGEEPLSLPSGETRRMLEDGDEVILRGHCEREGFRSIGFGECRGIVQAT